VAGCLNLDNTDLSRLADSKPQVIWIYLDLVILCEFITLHNYQDLSRFNSNIFTLKLSREIERIYTYITDWSCHEIFRWKIEAMGQNS
jgi:hypothetical protein